MNTSTAEDEHQVSCRSGPSFTDYLADFFEFLYRRTGFRLDNFQTPDYMRRLLDELSFNRVPLAVWQSLLASALRIAEMSKTIDKRVCHFGAFFVDVLCWICKRLMRMGVLKAGLFLVALEINPLVTVVIYLIYFVVEYLLEHFWDELSTFIQSRLIEAPYYRLFAVA